MIKGVRRDFRGDYQMEKWELYANAYIKLCKVYDIQNDEMLDKESLKKAVFYCVKYCISRPEHVDYDDALSIFQSHSALKDMIERLTPLKFMQLFPITKEYDGKKYGMKDYFYTMDYINTLEQDKPIPDALRFMAKYNNIDIDVLNVEMMMNLSDLRRYEGKPSLAQEWADMNGLPTYTKHTDHAGNEFLIDEHGKTQKVMKPRPKHLKLAK